MDESSQSFSSRPNPFGMSQTGPQPAKRARATEKAKSIATKDSHHVTLPIDGPDPGGHMIIFFDTVL
jgi:hypothetical protein